jgi:hypothetical protein
MATYRQLSLHLLGLERKENIYLVLQRIGAVFFFLGLIFLLIMLYLSANESKHSLTNFFYDVESILSLSGVTTATLASCLYAQAKLADVNERKTEILIRITRMKSSSGIIPYSFYKDVLIDSFKESLKQK